MKYSRPTVDFLVTSSEFGPINHKKTLWKKICNTANTDEV